jgi:hypothetical protein
MNWFKRKSKKQKLKNLEPLAQLIEDRQNPKKPDPFLPKEEYEIDGHLFKIGDYVIGRSNECDPLLLGEIVEFCDNEGKWSTCIPYVKDVEGKVWGVMGKLKPYSKELMDELRDLRPLEQWNHMLPKDSTFRYTEEDMVRKQKSYDKRKETFGH